MTLGRRRSKVKRLFLSHHTHATDEQRQHSDSAIASSHPSVPSLRQASSPSQSSAATIPSSPPAAMEATAAAAAAAAGSTNKRQSRQEIAWDTIAGINSYYDHPYDPSKHRASSAGRRYPDLSDTARRVQVHQHAAQARQMDILEAAALGSTLEFAAQTVPIMMGDPGGRRTLVGYTSQPQLSHLTTTIATHTTSRPAVPQQASATPRRHQTVEYSPSPKAARGAAAPAQSPLSPVFMYDTEGIPCPPRFNTLSYSSDEDEEVATANALAALASGNVTSSHVYNYPVPPRTPRGHAFPTPPASQQPELTRDEVEFARFSKFLARAAANAGPGAVAPTTEAHYRQFAQRPSASAAGHMTGIYNLTDEQLSDRFDFVEEVGYGNWGSVWVCRLRDPRSSMMRRNDPGVRLGRMAAMNGGVGAAGCVAIKLVHRDSDPGQKQRITALWREMKIIRSLRHEPHPSIIQFEAFVITPTYALIIMPYLAHTIPLKVPFEQARPWFRALTSAVAYLHERGITHNDIKPPNIVMNYNDVPVLVDFGFANKHDAGSRGRFLSVLTFGTPEYLDPQRSAGAPHDERAADVWALGVTCYEVLVGRTPFEWDEDETFEEQEGLDEYRHRTYLGEWLGHWSMPPTVENLLRYMICPDPVARITALEAYQHQALAPSKPSMFSTPTFVREAVYDVSLDRSYEAEMDESLEEHHQPPPAQQQPKLKTVKSDMTVKRTKKKARPATALGQPASEMHLRPAKTVSAVEAQKPRQTPVKRVTRLQPKEATREGTPTKVKPLRVQELVKDPKAPRVSAGEAQALPRPSSAAAVLTKGKNQRSRTPVKADTYESPGQSRDRDEAVARTMRSLEGLNARAREEEARARTMRSLEGTSPPPVADSREDAVARAMRSLEGLRASGVIVPQNSPRTQSPSKHAHQRCTSLDLAKELHKKGEMSRSAGIDRLAAVAEAETDTSFDSTFLPTVSSTPSAQAAATPYTPPRFGSKAPMLDVSISSDTLFTPVTFRGGSSVSGHARVLSEDLEVRRDQGRERARIASADLTLVSRFRGELPRPNRPVTSPGRHAKQSTAPEAVGPSDDNLHRLAAWAKTVELYVDEARKARAEGQDLPPLPAMPEDLGTISLRPLTPSIVDPPQFSSFGVIKPHKVTIESPPKVEHKRNSRPTLASVFGHRLSGETSDRVSFTHGQEHPLRRAIKRIPSRKSESALDKFGTAPADMRPPRIVEPTATPPTATRDLKHDPKGAPYQVEMLAPPAPAVTTALNKPTSMASLREKARHILHGDRGDREDRRLAAERANSDRERAQRERAERAERIAKTLPRNARFPEPEPPASGRQTPATISGRQTPATIREKRSRLFNLFKRG